MQGSSSSVRGSLVSLGNGGENKISHFHENRCVGRCHVSQRCQLPGPANSLGAIQLITGCILIFWLTALRSTTMRGKMVANYPLKCHPNAPKQTVGFSRRASLHASACRQLQGVGPGACPRAGGIACTRLRLLIGRLRDSSAAAEAPTLASCSCFSFLLFCREGEDG